MSKSAAQAGQSKSNADPRLILMRLHARLHQAKAAAIASAVRDYQGAHVSWGKSGRRSCNLSGIPFRVIASKAGHPFAHVAVRAIACTQPAACAASQR